MGNRRDPLKMGSERLPHVVRDLPTRRWKGLKIERLLELAARSQPLRILEIGTGSGGIAHYFATHAQLKCEVDAVDVLDSRLICEGYRFQLVTDTRLPFPEDCFDVVLSNHVIEHVGDETAQRHHLREIRRVMAPDGVGYLAVPNRWMLVEPHYRLAFLSWWPRPLRSPYLRLCGRGRCYDCEPLALRPLERMLEEAGLAYRNLCVEAWRATLEIEKPGSVGQRLLQGLPDLLLKSLHRVIPTLIYSLVQRRP